MTPGVQSGPCQSRGTPERSQLSPSPRLTPLLSALSPPVPRSQHIPRSVSEGERSEQPGGWTPGRSLRADSRAGDSTAAVRTSVAYLTVGLGGSLRLPAPAAASVVRREGSDFTGFGCRSGGSLARTGTRTVNSSDWEGSTERRWPRERREIGRFEAEWSCGAERKPGAASRRKPGGTVRLRV